MSVHRWSRDDPATIARRVAAVRRAKMAKLAATGRDRVRGAELAALLPDEPGPAPGPIPAGHYRCTGCGRLRPESAYPVRRDIAKGTARREARCRDCKRSADTAYRRTLASLRPLADPPLPPGTKRCSACHAVKPRAAFYVRKRPDKRGRVELHPSCIDCTRAKSRARYRAFTAEQKRWWIDRARARKLAKPEGGAS